jgi:hypothetical protein
LPTRPNLTLINHKNKIRFIRAPRANTTLNIRPGNDWEWGRYFRDGVRPMPIPSLVCARPGERVRRRLIVSITTNVRIQMGCPNACRMTRDRTGEPSRVRPRATVVPSGSVTTSISGAPLPPLLPFGLRCGCAREEEALGGSSQHAQGRTVAPWRRVSVFRYDSGTS